VSGTSASDARRVRLFGSLCALVFLVNFGRVVFAPLVAPLQADFVTSDAAVGLVATLAWLGSALPRLPTGWLLTRVDRHHVVLGTGALLAVSSAGMTLAPVLVGRVLLEAYTWRAPFYLLSAATVVATAVIYVLAGRTDLPAAGAADRDLLGAIRRQYRVVVLGVVIVGVAGLVWNGFFNFYIKYLTETKNIPSSTAETLLTVVFAAGVPAFWYTGRLADRFRHVPLMLAVLGGFVASLLAMTLVDSVVDVAAVSVVLGYAVHSLFPAIDTFLLDSLPDSDRASAYAGYSSVMMVVQAMGSVVVGTLVGAGFGYDGVFRVSGVALAVLVVALVALYRGGRLPAGAS
jgi:predicted MFS family arabinose efflux permease